MKKRYSSRKEPLDHSFLNQRLIAARSYDRIAGYFSSSILEVAGEALESISGSIRVVCNSDLDPKDVETARAANLAMRREWCASEPEKLAHENSPKRFGRLFEFLRTGKMQVKVLPSEKFGLVHGKAGVVTMRDGTQTSFLGSTNETLSAWKLNYELVWEDDSPEAVTWVQDEFNALWTCHAAVNLADFVVEDIGRLAKRTVIRDVESWREAPEAAAVVIEAPVYRREYGLWEHQKYFVKLAFDAHRGPQGARFVLADQVGLGKTVQLALSAMLMALYGDNPILILAPKPLLWQWQDEMKTLLDMPSAVWTGKSWVDENEVEHPMAGSAGVKHCPRRVGLVSQGLITGNSDVAEILKDMSFECVIVDECHRARRRNLGPNREGEKPDPNNLLRFLYAIAPRTKSLLLATATPVQTNPVEGWDLLNALAVNNESVLGNNWRSYWRRADQALEMVIVKKALPEDQDESWDWMRNPLPPASESNDLFLIRRALRLSDEDCVASPDAIRSLTQSDLARVRRVAKVFVERHNPFIRHIVRRTREFLENTLDPETGEPYLKPVKVELFGESDEEAIRLPPYLMDAYHKAEEFCEMLSQRMQASGFLKTILLRRIGSSIAAGMNTAKKMLGEWQHIDEEDSDGDSDEDQTAETVRALSAGERQKLTELLDSLEASRERDPKFEVVKDVLRNRGWLKLGCVIFSQYFDSVWWLAKLLSTEFSDEIIGIYAGSGKSGVIQGGEFIRKEREDIKAMVRRHEIRLLLGTEAASEGLNLQRLGTLINLDLPWNPTRLEQRKGRIQRIGQVRDTVYVYNMRYKDSVEDRVHHLLSSRLQSIYQLFGQIPDVLEDVWIDVALGKIESAKKTIDALPEQHPFEIKYDRIEKTPWESCTKVLDNSSRKETLLKGWY
jgi:superfamily II DNA or RNA helicase